MNQLKSIPSDISSNELRVFPNPNTGIFEIRLSNPDDVVTSVLIYNTTGSRIAFVSNPEILTGYIRITHMSHLQPGIYFISIKTKERSYIAKFVKI